MKRLHLIAGVALLLGTSSAMAEPALTSEARVAKAVAGRVAAAPVYCILQRNIRSSELVPDVGVIYTADNGTIYVNRPAGAPIFGGFDPILVTTTTTSQLCRGDIVRLIDRGSRMDSGSFGLGEFIPYPRPPRTPKRG